jgi:hypothetical protein
MKLRLARRVAPLLVVQSLGSSHALGQTSRAPESAAVEEGRARAEAPSVVPPRFLGGARPPLDGEIAEPTRVLLKLLVGRDGFVSSVEVVEGREPFSSAARTAAQSFVFEPARRGEVPAASFIHFELWFVPPPGQESGALEARPSQQTALTPPLATEPPPEIAVVGERRAISTRVISDAETRIIPGAEGDPIRGLQTLPGTVPTLVSGPFIGMRGAPPGLTGASFDDIELPYLFHLARGTAVVHPWLVESARLYGAGRPGAFGRNIGGQLDARAAAPLGRPRATGRLRLTEAALGAELPFAEGRGSVLAAGRYSYTEPLVSLVAPAFALDYWDYQGRLRYALSDKDTIELTAFGGHDMSGRRAPDGAIEELFNATFHRIALRFAQQTAESSMRIGVVYGRDEWDANITPIHPRSDTLHAQASGKVLLAVGHHLSLGADTGLRSLQDAFYTGPDAISSYQRTDSESAAWLMWSYVPSDTTELDLGVRADWLSSGDSPLQGAANYATAGPHFILSHELGRRLRLHTSVSYGAARPSPGQRPPARIYSVSGGLAHGVLSDFGVELRWPRMFSLDVTVFQNAYFNTGDVNTLRPLADQDERTLSRSGLARGQGQAYGLEVSLRRTFGAHLTGFVSYSLGHSWRSLGRVRGPSEFDRPHIIDAAWGYDFGRGWLLSLRGSFLSGYPSRTDSVALAVDPPRTTPYYQIDVQVSRRVELGADRALTFTLGLLNTTLNQETNDMFCGSLLCAESKIGPASIPTFGVDGEL